MPKHVSDSTFQLSVRIDTKALSRIDKVRDKLEKDTGARPQRSDIVRKAIDFGMDVYLQKFNIDVSEKGDAKVVLDPDLAPLAETSEPITVPDKKKPKKGAAKQARA